MSRPLVVDASPMIVLAKAGFLHLLSLAGNPVQVPLAVVQEIQQVGTTDPAVQALAQTPWLMIVDPGPTSPVVRAFHLGAGEDAVLAHPGTEAVIDDPGARHCALTLGLPCRGCLGLVLFAQQQGAIPAARPVVELLRQVGLRLSDRLMNQALAQVGE